MALSAAKSRPWPTAPSVSPKVSPLLKSRGTMTTASQINAIWKFSVSIHFMIFMSSTTPWPNDVSRLRSDARQSSTESPCVLRTNQTRQSLALDPACSLYSSSISATDSIVCSPRSSRLPLSMVLLCAYSSCPAFSLLSIFCRWR